MGLTLGLDGILYRNTGTAEAPTWSEMDNVKDLALNMTKREADVSVRGSNGWGLVKGTLKDVTLSGSSVYDTADQNLMAMHSAYLNNTVVDMACLDGDVDAPGTEGFRAPFDVLQFNITEGVEDAFMVEWEIKPTYAAGQAPEWMVVESASE